MATARAGLLADLSIVSKITRQALIQISGNKQLDWLGSKGIIIHGVKDCGYLSADLLALGRLF